jgi:hypothetical protein
MTRRHIVIPDLQIRPGDDLSFVGWIAKYIVHSKPDVLIQIGDWADMPSLSSWDQGKKSFEGRTYKADIEAANNALEILEFYIDAEVARLVNNKKKQWRPRKVITLGNHENRIDRVIESDRKLDGLVSTDHLEFKEHGWEVYPFLEPVMIDGVVYCHYLTSGVMGRPITTASAILTKRHQSAVVGHQQGRQVANAVRADGKLMTAIIAGSCYQHQEDYLGPQGNNHFRGIVVLNEVNDGQFDELFVSLNYLERKFGSKK